MTKWFADAVFLPADLNEDERAIAELLDRDRDVRWRHRNPPRKPDSVGLYAWDEGEGFFPDFVVAIDGRERLDQIALLEVKGPHLWNYGKEPEKAGAEHPDYGTAYFVGRRRNENDVIMLRRHHNELKDDGRFTLERLRW